MAKIAGVASVGNQPTNGVICAAWHARRLTSTPSADTALPTGAPDSTNGNAGYVESGNAYGGEGQYELVVPMPGAYYVSNQLGDNIAWQYAYAPEGVMVWRGAYDGAATYDPGDVVLTGGHLYICTGPVTQAPATDANWQEMV